MTGKEDLLDKTELEEYQEFVASCPQPSGDKIQKTNPNYLKGWWAASQMNCEAAEVEEIFEKAIRKGTLIDEEHLLDELGDVIWGLGSVCNTFGFTLDEVMSYNICKLRKRIDEASKKD